MRSYKSGGGFFHEDQPVKPFAGFARGELGRGLPGLEIECHGHQDSTVDGGAEFGVGSQALLDGVVDQRPELFLDGRVSWGRWKRDDFVVFGKRGDSLAFQRL